MPIPDAIANKPRLLYGLELHYMAFWDLMADRMVGMGGVGMIPYTAISRWMDDHGVTDLDERHRFKTIMHHLDMNYLEYERGRQKK